MYVCLAISPLLADGECLLLSFQFTCSREKLKDCVADELNTSSVTLCLLHNLTKTAEDGLTLCSSQAMPCHFPEVSPIIFSVCVGATYVFVPFSVSMKSIHLIFSLLSLPRCPLSAVVFQLQCTADPAGLLRIPPHQQHRKAGTDAAHPDHFPPAGGVASGGPV